MIKKLSLPQKKEVARLSLQENILPILLFGGVVMPVHACFLPVFWRFWGRLAGFSSTDAGVRPGRGGPFFARRLRPKGQGKLQKSAFFLIFGGEERSGL